MYLQSLLRSARGGHLLSRHETWSDEGMMKATVFAGLVAMFLVGAIDHLQANGMHPLSNGIAQGTREAGSEKNQPILQQWNGDYPVSALGRLPKAPVGFIADVGTFKSVWQAFMPGAEAPHVHFAADLVCLHATSSFTITRPLPP